jgi:hypothetical protein
MHANKERLFARTDSLSAIAAVDRGVLQRRPSRYAPGSPGANARTGAYGWTQSERAVATSFERTITWRLGLRLIQTDRFDGSN